ncbi:hypothetical protein COCOBI_13-0560 [Coccomyxa sp. Obi]|nr:hypothetical protein COCOBI_13-0560 [Coccomyxa sp. Obi]
MDEWEYILEPGISSTVAAAQFKCEDLLKEVDPDSDDDDWEILHLATTSEPSAVSFYPAQPPHIDLHHLPSSGSWQGEVSPDACLSPAPDILKVYSPQSATPKDTEADNLPVAENLPPSIITAAERSPGKKADSPNPAPYSGSENVAGSMSKICGKSATVSSSTGEAISGEQAEDGHMLQAAKNFKAKFERKLAVLDVLNARNLEQLKDLEARQIRTSSAIQSGSTGFVQPQADIMQQHLGHPHWSRELQRESGFLSMGDIGRADYRRM